MVVKCGRTEAINAPRLRRRYRVRAHGRCRPGPDFDRDHGAGTLADAVDSGLVRSRQNRGPGATDGGLPSPFTLRQIGGPQSVGVLLASDRSPYLTVYAPHSRLQPFAMFAAPEGG
jgi:hypothetical protein